MWLKEMLKETFSNKKDITLERYKAAKFAFIVSSFLFFINFYLVWANFYLDIFSNTLGILYIILILSLVFYIYFFIKKILVWKIPWFIFIIFFIILLVIFWLAILPITLENWFNELLQFIKLYY